MIYRALQSDYLHLLSSSLDTQRSVLNQATSIPSSQVRPITQLTFRSTTSTPPSKMVTTRRSSQAQSQYQSQPQSSAKSQTAQNNPSSSNTADGSDQPKIDEILGGTDAGKGKGKGGRGKKRSVEIDGEGKGDGDEGEEKGAKREEKDEVKGKESKDESKDDAKVTKNDGEPAMETKGGPAGESHPNKKRKLDDNPTEDHPTDHSHGTGHPSTKQQVQEAEKDLVKHEDVLEYGRIHFLYKPRVSY